MRKNIPNDIKILYRLKIKNKILQDDILFKIKDFEKYYKNLVTERCSNCEKEVTVLWDVEKKGYQVYCPNCGHILMFCSECMKNENVCDWDGDMNLCLRKVEQLWRELEDVLFIEDGEGELVLNENYNIQVKCEAENEMDEEWKTLASFPAGTDRESIWFWFDEHYPYGIGKLMYGGRSESYN